jgi:hypothetical protein
MKRTAVLSSLALVLLASGCGSAEDGQPATGEDDLTGSSMHRILSDADMTGDQALEPARVQAFLVAKKSALAKYSEDGRSAAKIIVEESRKERISPVFLLARIEGESGLVSSGTLNNLRSATGCGCPDGASCNPAFANFGPQVRCAAELFRGYLEDLAKKGATISGWRVGTPKQTLDPCTVTPANAATAALYTYTPWVGAYASECGTEKWGGTSLMGVLYRDFRKALGGAAAGAGEQDRADACPFGDGDYCGGGELGGDRDTLHACKAGKLTPIRACARGCTVEPPGVPDRCAGE